MPLPIGEMKVLRMGERCTIEDYNWDTQTSIEWLDDVVHILCLAHLRLHNSSIRCLIERPAGKSLRIAFAKTLRQPL